MASNYSLLVRFRLREGAADGFDQLVAETVSEIDKVRPESRCSRRREIVVLPAPDGEDSTTISPRRRISGAGPLIRCSAPAHAAARLPI